MSNTLYKFVPCPDYEHVWIIYQRKHFLGFSWWAYLTSVGNSQVGRWLDDRCREKTFGERQPDVYEVEAGGWHKKTPSS